jgi:transposase InsO family protein
VSLNLHTNCTQHEGGNATCNPVFEIFIHPAKPAQNALIGRFNRTYREAVLDAFLFHTVSEVQAISEDWLEEYNAIRPHEALGHVPPYQYVLIQM